ncbi:MAG: SRPBCC family protein [Pseudomonadota bacterium]
MTLDGQPRYGMMPWLEGDYLEYGYSSHLFPNMGFCTRQDNIHWVTQWPLSVDRSAADIHIMFPKEFHERSDFNDKLEDYKECFQLVIEEVRAMIMALQQGFDPGPMSHFERGVHHVIKYNLDRIFPETS